jgi:hypothetical protein
MGSNQIAVDNQLVTKPNFEAQGKESIFAAHRIVKRRMV